MKYKVPTEEFVLVSGGDLVSNPSRPTYLDVIEVPMGKYADLRVRVALVRSEEYGHYEDFVITSSESVYELMQTIDREPQETMSVVLLDAGNRVIGVHEVARGGQTQTIIDPKLLFQSAVVANAVSIILVHNHPSGRVEPSKEDEQVSSIVRDAATLLGFRLLDHVIIGDGVWTSLADKGLL